MITVHDQMTIRWRNIDVRLSQDIAVLGKARRQGAGARQYFVE